MCANISFPPIHDFAVNDRALHRGVPLVRVERNNGADRPARRGTVMDRGKAAVSSGFTLNGLRHLDAGTTQIEKKHQRGVCLFGPTLSKKTTRGGCVFLDPHFPGWSIADAFT